MRIVRYMLVMATLIIAGVAVYVYIDYVNGESRRAEQLRRLAKDDAASIVRDATKRSCSISSMAIYDPACSRENRSR